MKNTVSKSSRVVASALLALTLGSVGQAEGSEIVFTVGGDKDAGKAAAAGGKWSKGLTKAFKLVGKKLGEGGEMTVVLKVPAGDYDGDQQSGVYVLPAFKNEKATLRIEGGYSADFSKRDPFGTPSRFVTLPGRTQPIVDFKKGWIDSLKALVWDGFVMDAQKSNNYEKETNRLLKDGQGIEPMLTWGRLNTESLEVKNCVFVNAGRLAFDTDVWPRTKDGHIRLYNNIFLGCVAPARVLSSALRPDGDKMSKMEIDHCSFLINWAYDLDLERGDPCALSFSTCNSATEVRITNNLFYGNFGGAIKVSRSRAEAWTINGNNFVGNGFLFGSTKAGAGALLIDEGVGRHNKVYDLAAIEDQVFVEEAEDNVSIPPGMPITLAEVGPAEASGKETWEEELKRLLGRNLEDGALAIKDYAPLKTYDPAKPPFPTNPEAKKYGASLELVK